MASIVTNDAAPSRWTSTGRYAGPALALACAAALSSTRIVAAPGFEFYLGPLFYMLAYRWYGVKAALGTAVSTMAPSIWWWGHPISLALAIGHVVAIHRYYGRRFSFSTIAVVYQAVIGSAVAILLLGRHYGAPIEITLLVLLRKVLCEMMLAAIADGIVLFVARDAADGRFRRVRYASLPAALDALISIVVASATTLFLLGALHRLPAAFDDLPSRFAQAVRDDPAVVRRGVGRIGMLRPAGSPVATPFTVVEPARVTSAAQALGCQRIDADAATGPNDPRTFAYWLDVCLTRRLPDGAVAVMRPAPAVRALFGDILESLAPLVAFLVLAEGALILFRRRIWQSAVAWDAAVNRFGRGETIDLPPAFFREADELLNLFARLNNDFVQANHERHRLSRAVDELRAAIGLKLVSSVRFDADAGALRFTKLFPERGPVDMSIQVDAADHHILASSAGMNDAVVEFRLADATDTEWYLLLAHEFDSALACWRYGCIIRLRTSRAFQTQMRQNARLIELGGMASALSHELRQPLFTIALAAENGRLLLDADDAVTHPLARKLDRIVEQVERATAIVERTSTYARHERDDRQPVDLAELVNNAVRFMRPILVDRDVQIRVDVPDTLPIALLPRVGIEQILVNAIQNAADSIDQARLQDGGHPATIDIVVSHVAGRVTITIRDSGAGIADAIRATAFNAFSTTKPAGKGTGLGLYVCRQIIDEIGGAIMLEGNGSEPGATLTFQIPIEGRG